MNPLHLRNIRATYSLRGSTVNTIIRNFSSCGFLKLLYPYIVYFGTAFLLKISTFAQCTVVEIYRRFRGATMLIIALIMETASISETSVYFKENTRQNIPEGYHIHNR
jgi:hypothetical protein